MLESRPHLVPLRRHLGKEEKAPAGFSMAAVLPSPPCLPPLLSTSLSDEISLQEIDNARSYFQ